MSKKIKLIKLNEENEIIKEEEITSEELELLKENLKRLIARTDVKWLGNKKAKALFQKLEAFSDVSSEEYVPTEVEASIEEMEKHAEALEELK